MSCKNCKFAPKTYEEYCIAQDCPGLYCADAYTNKSPLCGLYTDTNGDYDEDEKTLYGSQSRLETVREERKDYEFNLVEEKKVAELAILNDTLALIYDYISEKK